MSTEQNPPPSTPPPEPPPADPGSPPPGPPPGSPSPGGSTSDKKLISGILGIVLGSLGVHKFYLGYQKEGIIMLVVCLVGGFFTCGVVSGAVGIIGLIEGILYLTKTDEEFDRIYVTGRKPWF